MKKVTLFAIILSMSCFFLGGCSGGADTTNDGINVNSKINIDKNKPAAPDNPGGSNTATPL